MAVVRWPVLLAIAAAVAFGAMAVATQFTAEPEPCRDNINIQPQVNAACVAQGTPTIVFGAGIAAASVVFVGFLVYRRRQAVPADS